MKKPLQFESIPTCNNRAKAKQPFEADNIQLARDHASTLINRDNLSIFKKLNKMSTTTAQQAREMTIFVIENGEVLTTNLFDHVAASATESTIQRGFIGTPTSRYKMFVDEVEDAMYEGEIVEGKKWALKEWQANGRAVIVDLFDTVEDAENEWFGLHKKYDFQKDDQRDTRYWHTIEEAQEAC